MRKLNIFALLVMIIVISLPAYADATFSDNWKQDSDGTWRVYDQNNQLITNAWFCDDAVAANGKDVWYLLDKSGNMVSAGLVQDGTGNYYSLETEHNGYYGMLRYKSGTYDGIKLELESSHDGSFAAIKNQDGIDKLKAKYGLKVVDIDNDNIVYSSNLKKADTKSTGSTAKQTGVASDGWVQYSNGKKYYYKNGTPLKGWQEIGTDSYYFDESTGALYAGRYTPDGYYVGSDGAWDGKEPTTDLQEQADQIAAKAEEEGIDIPLSWDAEGKATLKQFADKALASLNSANALVTEAKGLSDRKAAVKKYYAAVAKASGAIENMQYMEITMEDRPPYLLSNGQTGIANLQEAISVISGFDTFEIEDTTDITSAAFTNQFIAFNNVIKVINAVVAGAK